MAGLVQDRLNSSALAMELRLYCTNPSICKWYMESFLRRIEQEPAPIPDDFRSRNRKFLLIGAQKLFLYYLFSL